MADAPWVMIVTLLVVVFAAAVWLALRVYRPRRSGRRGSSAAAADLRRRAQAARERVPILAQQIEDLVRQVDPVELLAQLTLLYQTHPADQEIDREHSARWQVRIEWLSWLIFSRGLVSPPRPAVIDARVLAPLEGLLDEYYLASTMGLLVPVEGLSDEQNEVRQALQLEAMHVRGEGFAIQIEATAVDLFSPHDRWCIDNLGLTIADAIIIAKAVTRCLTEKIAAGREAEAAVRARLRKDPASVLTLDLPMVIRDGLEDAVPGSDPEAFANLIGMAWFFSKAPEWVGFTVEELTEAVAGEVPLERVSAFLDLLSTPADSIEGEPDPLALTPLARTPLIRFDGRFYMFASGLLREALFYAFHGRLFEDVNYRPRYDKARARWLEESAIDAFRRILPNSESGWNLEYGTKKHKAEIDGLIKYANKLILVECKWKSPTLLARSGDLTAAIADIDKAILQPLAQAKRARDYVWQSDTAEFTEKATGRSIVVRRDEVSEVFLVTLVGSGAWSQVAANMASFVPLGLFNDGEFPWALSLSDLRVVADCLELPSQLFDYLHRRNDAQRSPRFRFHDEWDLLGVYLAGALDVDDPQFAGKDAVLLDGFDKGLQDYYYSLSDSTAGVEQPRRAIPTPVLDLLTAVESATATEKTDAICVVLSWPDSDLVKLSEMLSEIRRRTMSDGKAHAVAARHPWKGSGITLACGHKNRRPIQHTLMTATESQRRETGAAPWVGFGIDLHTPLDVLVIYCKDPYEDPDFDGAHRTRSVSGQVI